MKAIDKAIKMCDLNQNPDDRVHQIVGPYSVQWDKGDGYFKIRKNGKVVAYAPTFEQAKEQALKLNSESD